MSDMTADQPLREQVARLLNPLWNKLGREVYEQVMAQVDTLLPLFAARERAAAENAWGEGYEAQITSKVIELNGRQVVVHSLPSNPYTVRAQLEGDGA